MNKQVERVTNFQDLVSIPFHGDVNAMYWARTLAGNFAEIVDKIKLDGNMTTVEEKDILELQLSEQGQVARDILLNDLRILTAHGGAPILNVIEHYEADDAHPFFPTDVYSFHVDRSLIPVDTFLCTYYGEPSEILPNSECRQKILIPEIRSQLKKLHSGSEENFETFLREHFFDLHYDASPGSIPISLGRGHLWRLATDHPGSPVLPCVHRAPKERSGQRRLLMIC